MRAIVVGAGISGLTCAQRLLAQGYDVRVATREPSARTTSAVAAAIWTPYAVGPEDRVGAWAARTYDEFVEQSRDPDSAVSLISLRILQAERDEVPEWAERVQGLRRLVPGEYPDGYAGGFAFTAPLAEMPRYLLRLATRMAAQGVRFEHRVVEDLDAELETADVVVNCTGLGARELVGDESVYPIRGQVVLVSGVSVPYAVIDDDGPGGLSYIVPRDDDIVLGGTADVGEARTAVDRDEAAAIRARCVARLPALEQARVEGSAVGLRPGRPEVRLQADPRPNGLVIHCYGHGGAGMTLCWGCAEDVAALVARGSE